MDRKIRLLGSALALSGMATVAATGSAHAERVVCHSRQGERAEHVYQVEASWEAVEVTYHYAPLSDSGRPAEVHYYWHSGLGHRDGLGATVIMASIIDSRGKPSVPALIAIDWITPHLGISYANISAGKEKFIIAKTDFECARLD